MNQSFIIQCSSTYVGLDSLRYNKVINAVVFCQLFLHGGNETDLLDNEK